MSHFLIFGRPRSRTAWVANFLTNKDSFCLHEGLADCSGSYTQLKKDMDALPASNTGNSDTGLIHHPRTALETFRNAKLVVMTGAQLSWEVFAQKRGLPLGIREQISYDYYATKKLLKDDALFVDVRTLHRPEIAEALWAHCTGSLHSFCEKRFHMLKDLNVQVVPESLERRLRV